MGNLKNFNQNLEHFLFTKVIFHEICYRSTFDKVLLCFLVRLKA